MNLRERPIVDEPTPDEDSKSTRKKRHFQQRASRQSRGPPLSPAKRSRRSVHALQHNQTVLDEKSNLIPRGSSSPCTLKKAPISEAEALAEKKSLTSLESRTLVRALESYGHNYPYISDLVLPIFGDSDASPKTLPQIRARCEQLIRSIVSEASISIPSNRLSTWLAKDVFQPPPLGHQSRLPSRKRRPPAPLKPRIEGTRKSSRQLKQRTRLDL